MTFLLIRPDSWNFPLFLHVAGAMLVFIPCVGEYVIPELLGGPQTQMIGRTLWDEFFSNNDWPMACAVAVTMVLLVIVIPPPPMSFGMFMPENPSSIAMRWCRSRVSSGSSPSCSSAWTSHGISSSSTNRRARSAIARSSSDIG